MRNNARRLTVARHLVGGVGALRLAAALQVPRDALAVVAAELIRSARGRRAVALVRPVRAVLVPVALPPDGETNSKRRLVAFDAARDSILRTLTTGGCN